MGNDQSGWLPISMAATFGQIVHCFLASHRVHFEKAQLWHHNPLSGAREPSLFDEIIKKQRECIMDKINNIENSLAKEMKNNMQEIIGENKDLRDILALLGEGKYKRGWNLYI